KAPRLRASTNKAATTAAIAAAAQTNSTGTRGEKLIPNTTLKFLLLGSYRRRARQSEACPPIRHPGGHASLCPRYKFLLLPEPFEQRRNMDLIGLVVAGQSIHDDVDAGAEREFALARFAGHQGQHRLAVGACRPGAGQIIRRYDDRGYAVAAARRALGIFVFVLGALQRLNPELARVEAAREITQEEERLGQHMVARHRLQFRNIERRQNRPQLKHAGTARLSAWTGGGQHGITGVEQHGAALFHIGVDARQSLGRRLLGAGHVRPIDVREERELVALESDTERS